MLFSGREKALLVDGSGNGDLKTACDYVHLNPVRAQLLGADQGLRAYCGSSFPFYLKEPPGRPPWLRVDRVLGEWGIPQDSPAGRPEFELRLETRRRAEEQPDFDPYAAGVDCRAVAPGGSQPPGLPPLPRQKGGNPRGTVLTPV